MSRVVKAGEVFTTFIFDGIDCADMGVFSATSSGTYTNYLEPQFKDEMLEVPAYDGRYYYGTQYSGQQFTFNLFADYLSMSELRNLKAWLAPRRIGKLILSDQPYKYYLVKITSISPLGNYPTTDMHTVDYNIVGEQPEGNVVYVGNFSVTFETVGSTYGYGRSYYRDDLIYDALDHYGKGIYPENYYYDSGLLYKDMSPTLTRTVPANAEDFPMTWYNPGTALASPTLHLEYNGVLPQNSYLQVANNTLGSYTVIDLSNIKCPADINCESEVIIDNDGKKIFQRFIGNYLEIGADKDVIYIPESYVLKENADYFVDYDSIYITKSNGETWAEINPLVCKVQPEMLNKYFCINANGGAKIIQVDIPNNKLQLEEPPITYEIPPKQGDTPSGFKCVYIGDYGSTDDLPATSNVGDVASVTYYDEYNIKRLEMYLYRYNKWERTMLFTDPEEFLDNYGNAQPQYLIFGANIVGLDNIKVSTNFGECEISSSFLPRYL